jgi:hypothetical protein
LPEVVLFERRQGVAVEVDPGIGGVERVGIRLLARIWNGLVVEVLGGPVLEGVLHLVAIGVRLAGVEAGVQLDRVEEEIVVVIVVGAVRRPVPVAVATGLRGGYCTGCRADLWREPHGCGTPGPTRAARDDAQPEAGGLLDALLVPLQQRT